MEECSKWHPGQSFYGFPSLYKEKCCKPAVAQDDNGNWLCKNHYERWVERQKPWIKRGYRPINEDEWIRGKSMKLCYSNSPTCYFHQGGVIMREQRIKGTTQITRIKTDLSANMALFCVKDY